jgi:hypothetical protein
LHGFASVCIAGLFLWWTDKQAVGTFAITFTKRLPSEKWTVLEYEVYTMSWGNATVYIQKKTVA